MQFKRKLAYMLLSVLVVLFLAGCGNDDDKQEELDPELEARIESLIVQLADEDGFIAASAADKLVKIGNPAIPDLIFLLELPKPDNRKPVVIQILKDIGTPEALQAAGLSPDWIEFVKQHVIFEGPNLMETWELKDFEIATLFDNWHNVYTENNGQPLDRTGKWYWEDRGAFKDEDRKGKDDSPQRKTALAMRLT